ncbi:SH3 domain-containing protein [Allostreptomyces psammosilenae]|uniref:SH3b domain-containing protein n=1 Tax=Allostreptomyces psammosilenae TaxID=1892865 RepID=A0A852ZXR9_9ACTN|nr:SH3 domain-containing protein [Allostreptomyces psammosilenae]NYI03431.1 hypothetical protein [Allostreptomyces psammosilenae]
MRPFRSLTVATIATTALVMPITSTAQAAPTPQQPQTAIVTATSWTATVTTNGVRIRSNHSTSSTILGLAYRGQRFTITRSWYGNGATWYYGTNRSTGVRGWIHGAYLSHPGGDTPTCPGSC